jgi:hypothetical protein
LEVCIDTHPANLSIALAVLDSNGMRTVTLIKNVTLTALNKLDDWLLSLGVFDGDCACEVGVRPNWWSRERDQLAVGICSKAITRQSQHLGPIHMRLGLHRGAAGSAAATTTCPSHVARDGALQRARPIGWHEAFGHEEVDHCFVPLGQSLAGSPPSRCKAIVRSRCII